MSNIVSARYADADRRTIAATCTDGSTMLVPAAQSNRHYRRIVHGDPDTGVAAIEIASFQRWSDLADARAALAAEVKAEAGRRIVDVMPEWKQRNAIAHAVALIRKVQLGGVLTADESASEAGYAAVWSRVSELRAASDRKEAEIAKLADLGAAETYAVEAGWPA